APIPTLRTSGRSSRRACGRERRRRRCGATRPKASSSSQDAGSSPSTSVQAPRRTTQATSTPGRSCCSPPALARARFPARRASSASGDRVETQSGKAIEADAVVAGLGVTPDTELAEAAALEVDDGIVVDEYGRVPGHENVFAAGDVARFPVSALGTSLRIEHEDHANMHGHAVGANMAGADTPYNH